MQPTFSIIVATYNVADTLPACLESIAAQEGATYEVLVADGASTDGTCEILEAARDRFKLLISEPDRGVYDAWNKLLPHATGKWVLFLGADDELSGSDVLAAAAASLSHAVPDTMYAYGRVRLQSDGEIIETFGQQDFPTGKWRVRRHRPFSHTGLFHRRELFERFGAFDPSYRIAGDSEFLTRTLIHNEIGVLRLDQNVAIMGMGGLSSSLESRLTAYLEDIRGLRTHGHWLPPLPTLALALRAFIGLAVARIFGRNAALKLSNAFRAATGRAPRTEV